MKKHLIILSFIIVMLLLGACGTLDVKINKDGSGSALYTIPKNEMVDAKEVEHEINRSIEQINLSAGEEVMWLKNFRERRDEVTAEIQFSSISAIGYNSIYIPVSDMMRYNPSIIENVVDATNGDSLDMDSLDHIKNFPVIHLTNLDTSFETTITVPGKILYHSSNTSLVEGKNNQIEVNSSTVTIIYKDSSNVMVIIIPFLVIILIAFAAYWFIFRKTRLNRSEETPKETTGGETENV